MILRRWIWNKFSEKNKENKKRLMCTSRSNFKFIRSSFKWYLMWSLDQNLWTSFAEREGCDATVEMTLTGQTASRKCHNTLWLYSLFTACPGWAYSWCIGGKIWRAFYHCFDSIQLSSLSETLRKLSLGFGFIVTSYDLFPKLYWGVVRRVHSIHIPTEHNLK